MTTGVTGGAGSDVLTFGGRREGPSWSAPTRSRFVPVLLAGTLLGAGAGAAVGAQTGPPVTLVAGPLREAAGCSSSCLTLTVRNAGQQPVAVLPVALGQAGIGPGTVAVVARPGRRATVLVPAPVECEGTRPGHAATITLRVDAGSGTQLVTLPLPGGLGVPASRYDRFCPAGRPVTRSDLPGWWASDLHGHPPGALSPPRLRFRADDTFELWRVDSSGDARLSIRGRYGVAGRLLTLTVSSPSGRRGAHSSTWRGALVESRRLHLVRVSVSSCSCGLAPGGTWTVRRAHDPRGGVAPVSRRRP